MAAYRRVCDSHHLQADCQEPGSATFARTLTVLVSLQAALSRNAGGRECVTNERVV